MVSPGITAIVQRLLSDDGFVRTFLRAPDLALSGQTFSAEERRALLRIHARLTTADGPDKLHIGPEARWP
jgi:hypothetical protein